ncbi:SGNH/GDSL hydrolase family protein [Mucilaginibacter myungsuensis]|uniref:G-D-S-L family lipolytic protein n=1 Tax=Mucilaginibacter myungsuensis TaxID=649104 RepID=A0A929PV20_9SPHI|nr:SGNH/GDSL hydrolase family protein [Mucilaginibacter myungsuensis]MBE9660679.1 G-D-S-L family lipolytic protein [Mucilaginibacter myungsuensis]MDN3600724.1 SGNH/GDSL hydrolase family protein [Mucilaginibacter myungsuensis]
MKNLKTYSYILFAGMVGLASCKPNLVSKSAVSAGSLDLTRYIAVGNSLTAGYADGGLYREGQLNSYPAIIAKQMQSVGGGAFNQPLFTEAQANGSGYLRLTGFNQTTGAPITAPVTTGLAVTGQTTVPTGPLTSTTVTTYTKYTGDINNFGVPGIKLVHATIASYGNLNGFYERLLPGAILSHNTAYLDFVTAKPFTFFTNWLGNNDALNFATTGGVDALTDKATFTAAYTNVIAKLTATGAKGAVATIPDVTTIPFLNTVTPAAILAAAKAANSQVQAIYVSGLVSGTNYQPRVATNQDLIVLTFPTSLIGSTTAGAGTYPYGLHPLNPIENKYVLDAAEVSLAKDYVVSYNASIKAAAAAKGLAVFDANTFLTNLKAKGLVINGVSLNANFISGGIFSLDGVHLTQRGYAIVANEFISAINAQYNSSIPTADVSSFPSVKFP